MRAIAEQAQLVALYRGLEAQAIEERRRILGIISTAAAETRAQLAHRKRQRREGAAYAIAGEREHGSATAFRRARQAKGRALRERKAHRAEVDDDQPEASRLEEHLRRLQLIAPFALLCDEAAARGGRLLCEADPHDAREVGARGFEAARIECARDIDPSDDLATTRGGARKRCGYRRLARAEGPGDFADAAAREPADERIDRRDAAGQAAFFAGQLVAFEDSRKLK